MGKSRKKLELITPAEPGTSAQPLDIAILALDWRTKPVRFVSQDSRTCELRAEIFSSANGRPSEISDVLPAGSVAVAVKNPLANVWFTVREKFAFPLASVVALVKPRKILACGWLAGAKSGL